MKKLLLSLVALFLLATHADARFLISYGGCVNGTLTISDLGNAGSTSSTATLVTGSTITAASGDMLVALVAADNNGASGVASLTSVQDSQSNTWTQRALINYTPGSSAADGATLGIFTATVSNALSSGTVTANFSPNTTSKAMEVYLASPSAGCSVAVIDADSTGNTGSSTVPFANTVSVTSGDTIFATAAIEDRGGTVTADSDTTNGNWSTIINRLGDTGSAGTSQFSSSQYKTVNATGNQTWNISVPSSRDWAASYLILRAQ